MIYCRTSVIPTVAHSIVSQEGCVDEKFNLLYLIKCHSGQTSHKETERQMSNIILR